MRFAGQAITPQRVDEELLPNTGGVSYPQDNMPAGSFGNGVDPTDLPGMRDRHMRGLKGGISQLAPSMVDGYVDHPAVQDTEPSIHT